MNKFKVTYARATSKNSIVLTIEGANEAAKAELAHVSGAEEGEVYISGVLAGKFLNQATLYNRDAKTFNKAKIVATLYLKTEYENEAGEMVPLKKPELRFEAKTWKLRLNDKKEDNFFDTMDSKGRIASGIFWTGDVVDITDPVINETAKITENEAEEVI